MKTAAESAEGKITSFPLISMLRMSRENRGTKTKVSMVNRSPHHAGYQEMARGARAPHIPAHPRGSFLRTSPPRSQTPQFRKVTALGKEWDESEADQATPSSHPASKQCSRPHSSQPRRGGALGRPWRTRPPPGFVQTEARQEADQHHSTEPGHEQDGGRLQAVAPHRSSTYTELKVTEHQIPSLDLISGYSAACERQSSAE